MKQRTNFIVRPAKARDLKKRQSREKKQKTPNHNHTTRPQGGSVPTLLEGFLHLLKRGDSIVNASQGSTQTTTPSLQTRQSPLLLVLRGQLSLAEKVVDAGPKRIQLLGKVRVSGYNSQTREGGRNEELTFLLAPFLTAARKSKDARTARAGRGKQEPPSEQRQHRKPRPRRSRHSPSEYPRRAERTQPRQGMARRGPLSLCDISTDELLR